MPDCLFCDFATGKMKPSTVYEDADYLAFRDINPQAPVHILVIPKRHVAKLTDLAEADAALLGGLYTVANKVAQKEGFFARGYRAVINCEREAGQSVWHVHLHVLSGRAMGWPPG